jgi:DNA-binding NarL/FixJ family response regulator/DNA-binding XRE family transcriptional regulator
MADIEGSFGEQLRQLRVRAGLSQAALAERAGLAAAAVAALERGVRRSPYPQTFGALADALKLTPEERAALAEAASAARRGQPRPPQPAPMSSQRELRLMLVDDEDLYRDLLQTALGQQPQFTIVGTFRDAATALADGPALRPDVAVLDIELGAGPDGIHLGLALRQSLPEVGIVLLSNHADLRFVTALHKRPITGWSYLLKQSVRDVAALRRAIEGAAEGDVVLDPRLVAGLQPRAGGPLDRLTPRQRDVLGLVAQGLTNAAIAQQLVLAEKSVENQLTDIYEACGIERREQQVHARVKAVLLYLQASRFVSSGAAMASGASSARVSGRSASRAVP